MKLGIIGATGGTGVEIVKYALSEGYTLNVLARTPSKLAVAGIDKNDANLNVIQGDTFSVPDLRKVFHGCDAVLSALGSGGFFKQTKKTTFYSASATCIVEAMREEGVKRLIAITSSGVEEDKGAPLFYRLIIRRLLMPTYNDMNLMEAIIEKEMENGLEWTIVRPSFLINGKSKTYRANDRANPAKGWIIHRVDTAKFMVDELKERKWISKHPALAY